MSKFWTLIIRLHSVAGYASVGALQSLSKLDDEQWLFYWTLYSFFTLTEMVLQPLLNWMPIWYVVKLSLLYGQICFGITLKKGDRDS